MYNGINDTAIALAVMFSVTDVIGKVAFKASAA